MQALHVMQASGTRKRAVVLCHGFASHRDGFHLPTIGQHLAQKGLSSLRFDMAGNGESEGTFEYGNYHQEADDIRAAVLHLRSKGYTVDGIVGAPRFLLQRCRACLRPRARCLSWSCYSTMRCHVFTLASTLPQPRACSRAAHGQIDLWYT